MFGESELVTLQFVNAMYSVYVILLVKGQEGKCIGMWQLLVLLTTIRPGDKM